MKKPDETNWKKLSHEMKYLQYTRHLPLILRADGNGVAIWIDASHAVHADMKGHVGTYAVWEKVLLFQVQTESSSTQ